jgi:23S rRNA pseudouridine2604 synthase
MARPAAEGSAGADRRPRPSRSDRPRPTTGPRRDAAAGDRSAPDTRPPRRAADRRPPPTRTTPTTPAEGRAPKRPPPPRTAPPDAGERLSKRLAAEGAASRREADEWIAAGWVRVDGVPAVLGQRVLPEQRIDVDPAARRAQAKLVTILLHKPVGYVSGQPEDDHLPAASLVTPEHRWADERRPWHPGHAHGLAPAGRLDIDSTGLLVLTQDGRVARRLIGEDSGVEKEYLVRVEHDFGQDVPADLLQRLRHGLELDGKPLQPAKVSWANEDQLRFVLREGRKRQIRRMCELVGLKVTGLKRVRIGSVVLGKLPAGQWRYLRDDERF